MSFDHCRYTFILTLFTIPVLYPCRLADNAIGDEGAKAIFLAITGNTTLTVHCNTELESLQLSSLVDNLFGANGKTAFNGRAGVQL